MGQARETMDRVTAAVMSGDRDALGQLYAADAVAETPDEPRLQGGAAIVDYLLTFKRAFPDASSESAMKYEAGDTAIDEGYFVGTHTGVLSTPEGEVPPTGRSLRLRECDILEVADGVAVAHRSTTTNWTSCPSSGSWRPNQKREPYPSRGPALTDRRSPPSADALGSRLAV